METYAHRKPSAIDEWQSNFNNQVSALRDLLAVRSVANGHAAHEEVSTAFEAACKSLADVDQMFVVLNQYIQQEEAQLAQLDKLRTHLHRVSTQMRAIEKQMPSELKASLNANSRENALESSSQPQPHHAAPAKTLVNEKGTRSRKHNTEKKSAPSLKKLASGKSPVKTRSKTTKRRVEKSKDEPIPDPPQIRYVTQEELDDAPQYVKGRLSIEKISTVVDKFNVILEKKYTLLSRPFRELTSQEMSKYEDLRDAFCPEVSGKEFITDSEIKGFGGCRMDAAVKSVINILRHVSAMKEIRGKNKTRIFIIN
ncbi:Spindle and kinetochore-associated protein [Gracilaria domingensis]|nr:Spindle and kinetochore-associated protein [Gracilaria domingensis]